MNRILVIDDSPLVSNMVSEFLSTHGYEVALAHDANQGFIAATQQRPDLILLDVHLPDVIGYEVCKVLRSKEETKHIPIIMVTGEANQTEHKVRGFQAGADDYLLKPFDNQELLERIRAVLRRSVASRPQEGVQSLPAGQAGPKSNVQGQSSDLGPGTSNDVKRLSIARLFGMALLAPQEYNPQTPLSGVSLVYLAAALSLCLGGAGIAAEPTVKPAVVAAAILGTWGVLVFVSVMSASLMGTALAWSEAAGILSLAAAPFLLKFAGGFGLTLLTTLSPFHFTLSPTLFQETAPDWQMRLDVFELWSAALFYFLLSRRFQRSRGKAATVTLLVWAAGIAIATGLDKLGGH